MTVLFHVIRRSVLPIGLSLAVIAVLLAALSVAPARATTPSFALDQSEPRSPAQPQGSLQIPIATAPMTIPIGTAPSKLDGFCDLAEWVDAKSVEFQDYDPASGGTVTKTVYLKHDNTRLYVCLAGSPGSFADRFASVYLDTLDTKKAYAGPTDYALKVPILTPTLQESLKGTGVPNGYTLVTLPPGSWTAAATFGNADEAEYSIGIPLTGGACGQPFGLAVYHHWVTGVGIDFGWPSNKFFDQPQTWMEVQLDGLPDCTNKSNIAYVYKYDTAKATDFKNLLTSVGYGVDLIPMSAVTATNFTTYTEIIVADDTGSLNTWGAALLQVTPITIANKPIIGLGEGGYAFYGQIGSPIGWPHGWHGPAQFVVNPVPAPTPYYFNPFDLSGLLGSPIKLYQALNNEVGIYVPANSPLYPTVLGWELPSTPTGSPDHAPLISDSCHQLWGFSESPTRMTPEGQRLFLNAVRYGYAVLKDRYCSQPPPPPSDCVTLVKSAVPPSGTTVTPTTSIMYTLAYTVSQSTQCKTARSLLIDQIPANTLFVPGSATPVSVTDVVSPNFAGTLIWDLGPLAPGAHDSKSFKVSVLDTGCREQRPIGNIAKLQTDIGVFTSNTTTHKLDCPPVVPPNNDPPYAESEIQVYPYPLVTGQPTKLSVRVFNTSAASQTVTVTFMTSANRFGIGIPFGALPVPGNPRVLTIGGLGYAEVVLDWVPISSGHYCIMVKIESAGYDPIFTYRNLDVTEDLKPGVTDVLTFSVANPHTTPATIDLVVINTCPGWTASVTPTGIIANPGIQYTSTLRVTPPNPAVLGTGCHIDVQGWIGDELIGGIRKLDVPPVNLPHSDPPWLEKEITTVPTPPISGTVNHVYIELNNPWPFQRVVTVTFSEAVFGAGIPFTPFITQVLTLPANSLQKYGVPWTPIAAASLHRCILVTLQQPGFQDQISQRNVDLVRRPPIGWDPGGVLVPFAIGNPFDFPSKLDLNGILIGLNKWKPQFTGPGGGDPPLELGPHETWMGELQLVPAVQQNSPSAVAAEPSISGDAVRVDVSVSLNDQPYNGFSVDFAPPLTMYLPIILR
jgi:hypothetical protein